MMIDKPLPKREVAVVDVARKARCIMMNASPDAAREFSTFGILKFYKTNMQYWLIVDARYDFDEVLMYIQNYG